MQKMYESPDVVQHQIVSFETAVSGKTWNLGQDSTLFDPTGDDYFSNTQPPLPASVHANNNGNGFRLLVDPTSDDQMR